MKNNLFLKFICRSALVYVFIFAVLAIVSYGFVGKAVEYIIVQRETNRLEGYYRSIGQLNTSESVLGYTQNDAYDLIKDDPGIASIEPRHYSSGELKGIYNTDFLLGRNESIINPLENRGVNNQEVYFFGTFTKRESMVQREEADKNAFTGLALSFFVDQVLAGYPEIISPGKTYGIYISLRVTPNAELMIQKMEGLELGKRYLIHAYRDTHTPTINNYPGWSNTFRSFWAKPVLKDQWFIEIPPGQENLLGSTEFSEVRAAIDLLNTNLHSLLLVGTDDMSAMPQMQESQRLYYLTEGRWINRLDNTQRNCGIVISEDLAFTRALKIGDTIDIKLRSLKDPFFGYIRAQDAEGWDTYPSFEDSFEVVGVYANTIFKMRTGPSLTGFHDVHALMAFIPNTCMPPESRYAPGVQATDTKMNDSSFILTDPRLQEAIKAKYADKLAAIGFELSFVDNNALNFLASSKPIKRSALTGFVLFSLVMLIAQYLAVQIYLRQQRRNFAIARALGVRNLEASRQLSQPIAILALLATGAGALISWNQALYEAAQALSQLPTPAGVFPQVSLSLVFLLGLWLLIYLVIIWILFYSVRKLRSLSVLALLQDESNAPKARAVAQESELPPSEFRLNFDRFEVLLSSAEEKLRSAVLIKFGMRQTTRGRVRSLLSLLLGLGFVLVLGWLHANILANRAEIQDLYQSIEVPAELVVDLKGGGAIQPGMSQAWGGRQYIQPAYIKASLETGFIKRVFLSRGEWMRSIQLDAVNHKYRTIYGHLIHAFNDLNEAKMRQIAGAEIKYLPGFDESMFSHEWTESDLPNGAAPMIMGEDLLAFHGLEPGDTVTFLDDARNYRRFYIAGSYSGGAGTTKSTLLDLVAGTNINTGDYLFLLVPLSAHDISLGRPTGYFEATFYIDPKFNRDLSSVKAELETILAKPGMTQFPFAIKFWDEELNAAVQPLEKNLSLLEVLYPVSVAVSILIGFGLSIASVLQHARESALLRMLGVGVVPLRLLLSGTRLFLALLGVLLGVGLLALLRGPVALGAQVFAAVGLYLLGVLLGTLLGAVLVSRRKPMELLQVKE